MEVNKEILFSFSTTNMGSAGLIFHSTWKNEVLPAITSIYSNVLMY